MLIDDVLATGGTALAVINLLNRRFGVPPEKTFVAAVINLEFLGGRRRLQEAGTRVDALLDFHE
jgi:adenine/guanine phosphoribosyltransferase-like PRPP-binding protein